MEEKNFCENAEETAVQDFSAEELVEYENVEKCSQSEERYQEIFESGGRKTLGFSIAALILSIISVMASISGIPGIVLGILAIAVAVFARYRLGYFDKISITAIILGIFGSVFGAFGFLILFGPLKGLIGR